MKDIKTMDLELINLIDHDTTKIFAHRIPLVYKEEDMEISEDNSLVDRYHDNNDDNDQKNDSILVPHEFEPKI